MKFFATARFLALMTFICLLACNEDPKALVHITYPKQYRFIGQTVISDQGVASVSLAHGQHTLQFEKGEKRFASVVHIVSGGECYLTLEDKNMLEVTYVGEAK